MELKIKVITKFVIRNYMLCNRSNNLCFHAGYFIGDKILKINSIRTRFLTSSH